MKEGGDVGFVRPTDSDRSIRVLETAVRCARQVAKGEMEPDEAEAEVASETLKSGSSPFDTRLWNR